MPPLRHERRRHRMRATFSLLEAPDSLAEQSRRNPDAYGLATFDEDGTPVFAKARGRRRLDSSASEHFVTVTRGPARRGTQGGCFGCANASHRRR